MTLSPRDELPGSSSRLEEKENFSRAYGERSRVQLRYRTISYPRRTNINALPFRSSARQNRAAWNGFPKTLGPADSRRINLLAKPLPASALKIHISVFATTTKICTRRSFTLPHGKAASHTSTPSYSLPLRIYGNG